MAKVFSRANRLLGEVEADPSLKLDPEFFTSDNKLQPEIVAVLHEVTQKVVDDLKKKKFELDPHGVILTGSLTSVNFDDGSDVDFHILVDFKNFADPVLTRAFLTEFARGFNKKFELRGRDLELYFQDKDEPHITPGIYDITNDTWLMPPNGEKIEKTPEMKQAADAHKSKVLQFNNEWLTMDKKDKKAVRAFLEKLSTHFEGLRKMRKDGISQNGIASVGNQVFKMLRRNDTFKILTDMMAEAQDEIFDA